MTRRINTPNPAYAAVAGRLGNARRDAGCSTPEAAAVRLGMPAWVFERQEQCYAKTKPDDLKRYADLFGVSVGWLTTGIGTGPR